MDAREYHERTNHSPRSLRESGRKLDPSTKPRPFKRYRDVPAEPLSSIRPPVQPALAAVDHTRADPLAGAEQPAREGLDRETLATICYEAAGIVQRVQAHDGRELRFRAASATGNLHHVDLYLVCGDLEGLEAGVYHFDPTSFSLDVLREGDYRAALAAAVSADEAGAADTEAADAGATDADAAAAVANAPLSVVATSTWARNAWKYRDRTYRHAFWDAGTILANLLATAHALDYRAEVLASFADRAVADLVGVDPEREAPIALAPIGVGERAPADPPQVDPIDPAIVPPTDDPADTATIHDAWRQSALADGIRASEASTGSSVEHGETDGAAVDEFRASCLERGPIGTATDADASRSDSTSSGSGDEPIALDPVDAETASARPLHATIQRRGSCREYADEGPTRRQVATVLDRALGAVPADWNAGGRAAPAAGDGSAGLTYNDAYVLATDVDGLDDGTYRLAPGRGELRRIDDVDAGTKARLALGQDWAGDAHVNVYLLADLDAVVEALGNRGYRLAQLEAGVALGRLYLATYAHRDLGGLGLTFFDELVAEQLASEASGRRPTTLFAFGKRAG